MQATCVFLGASRHGYVHHEWHTKSGIVWNDKMVRLLYSILSPGRTTSLYAALSRLAAIMVVMQTVRAAAGVVVLSMWTLLVLKAYFLTQGPWWYNPDHKSGSYGVRTILQSWDDNMSVLLVVTGKRPFKCCKSFGVTLVNTLITYSHNSRGIPTNAKSNIVDVKSHSRYDPAAIAYEQVVGNVFPSNWGITQTSHKEPAFKSGSTMRDLLRNFPFMQSLRWRFTLLCWGIALKC